MHRQCLIIVLLVGLFVYVLGTAAPIGAASENFQETYEVKPGTTLEVQNKNGSVEIARWDKPQVEVWAEKKADFLGGKLDKVKIEVTAGDVMSIKTVYLEENPRVSVTYIISVPKDVSVKSVESSNGAITLKGTQGDVTVETSNGRIEVEGVNGNVKAKTSNGKIEITSVQGSVEARTNNGEIAITKVTEIRSAETSNGRIRAEIQEMRDDVELKTSNGAIELYLSPKLNIEIEMKTSNGKISTQGVNITSSESSDTKLNGKIGSGGKQLSVKTSNGSITVYKLAQ
jgi:DUF4097 and DUF4098 domain-containing protein YvlB